MLRDGSTASIWEEMQGLTVKNEQEEGHARGMWETRQERRRAETGFEPTGLEPVTVEAKEGIAQTGVLKEKAYAHVL